jgi:hypothetical protein
MAWLLEKVTFQQISVIRGHAATADSHATCGYLRIDGQ